MYKISGKKIKALMIAISAFLFSKRKYAPVVNVIALSVILWAGSSFGAYADTVDLKSGKSFYGIVLQEDDKSVEFDIGFGTMVFRKDQIVKITRSSEDELKDIKRKWGEKKKGQKQKEEVFAEDRDKRFAVYEEWSKRTADERRKGNADSKKIKIARDIDSNSVLTEVMLNEKVKATLVLDTGASIIVLSRKKGNELGIDFSDLKKDMLELSLAGGRKALAKAVILKSVGIADVIEKNVMAAILVDDVVDSSFKDGLLGRTFLDRFNISLDMKNMTMSLESLRQQ